MKRIKKLLVLILALSMLISSSVYADYNGSEQGGTSSGTKTVKDGPSVRKCGVLIYTVNKNTGQQLGGSARLLVSNPTGVNKTVITSRLGNIDWKGYTDTPSEMPSPVKLVGDDWVSNGNEVREWLTDEVSNGVSSKPRYETIITKKAIMDDTQWNEWKTNKSAYVVIVEPIFWSRVYDADGNNYKGHYLMGTAYIWAKLNNNTLKLPNGAPLIRRFTHNAIQNCMVLQTKWFNVFAPTKSGYVSWSDISDHGYGLHIIDLNSDIATTKTDEPAAMEVDPANIGTYNVIKCYENQKQLEDGQTEPVYEPYKTFVTTNAPSNIYVESEESYTVTNWAILNTKVNSTDSYDKILSGKTAVESGTSDSEVALDDTKPTLVVRLRDNSDLVLPERTINVTGDKQLTQSKITQSFSDLSPTSLRFASAQASGQGHVHHSDWHSGSLRADGSHSSGHWGHTCKANNENVDDAGYTMKMVNGSIDSSILANTTDFKMFYTAVSGNRTGATSFPKYLNNSRYTYTLTRHVEDQLTLCNYAGNVYGYTDNKSDIKNLVNRNGKTPVGTRKTLDYVKTLAYALIQDKTVDYMTKAHWSGCSANVQPVTDLPMVSNDTLSSSFAIAIRAYSGKTKSSTDNKPKNLNISTGDDVGDNVDGLFSDNVYGVTLAKDSSVKIYPFVQMQYNKATSLDSFAINDSNVNGETSQAYVLSQYERTIPIYDYAQTAWKRTSSNNMTINSNQFSSHARATQGTEAWNGKYVLPGGAMFNLDNTNDNQPQQVMVQTIHTLVTGTLANAKTSGGDLSTESRAKEEFEDILNQSIESLDNLNVAQYVGTDYNGKAWDSGQIVERGADLNLGNGSSKSSSDMKYYFTQREHSDEDITDEMSKDSDLDVTKGNVKTEYFGVYADTDGTIKMTSAQGSVNAALNTAGRVIVAKDQDGKTISDEEARYLNDRTMIITNLASALERNTGNDTNAQNVSDGKWYNEATPRFILMRQSCTLDINFKYTPGRMQTLDPKLCPMNVGMSDLFSNAYVMQFRCYDYTENNKGNTDYLGTIRGTNLNLSNMSNLMYTNPVYIPNVNVQDLLN